MVKLLYNLSIPTDALVSTGSQISQEVAEQGSVGEGGGGSAIPVAGQPGEESLQGAFRDPQFGGVMGQEVEELFDAGGIEYVPLAPLEDGADADANAGYYALKDTSRNRVHPNTDAIQAFDGTATKQGTKKSHVRAVRARPSPVDTVGQSEYSNADPPARSELVCLPIDAARVRWYDPVSGTVAPADPLNRWQYPEQAGEFVDFRWYDLADAPFYDPAESDPTPPTLVYEYPYDREYRMDVKVWDTVPDYAGPEKVVEGDLAQGARVGGPDAVVGDATVGESPREGNVEVSAAWQHVFSTGHDFSADGECVLDNGVLRLRLDDGRGAITAETSRGGFDDWADQPLRSSAWALQDVDLSHIGLARVGAQLDFEHGTTGERYALDVSLPRGYDGAVFTVAQNQDGAAPFGLSQKLAPIAKWGGVTVRSPNASADLVAREDLRR